ncbi:putative phosphatidylglycerol specific protein [Botrytis fragariae]|uniref:Putative phosphatidylglycerol specific protein n=1 Tax=Botrytis fragariae TaxID=1964551 RepID=A0A8H6B5E4_9HELO|nr:putative phosphatidylglycerol specific protein [Botrytis fragariae]KAF5879565.1 putative phosphatidylglycerol specific protein [Botrytis fragariae]
MFGLEVITIAALSGVALAAPQNIQYHETSDNSWKSRIKNVVVLVEENRSFDTFAGGLSYNSAIDGLLHHNYCNSMNASNPGQKADVCAGPRANDVAADDPNHSISGVNMQLFTTYHPSGSQSESMRGFVTEQSITYSTLNKTRAAEAINYYTPDQVKVFNTMAENFVLFDRWFASVPGPTNPNRAYITSGTSHGHGKNDNAFNVYGIPVKSIFEQLSENDITWMNYQNSTLGPGLGFNPDAAFYNWTLSSGAYETNIAPLTKFYEDAAAGTLPQFTYINPECCSYQSYHPPSPISSGESFIKGIYEAIRSSPQWNETLFILTFDEHGAPDGKNMTFDFKRLGVRVPTLLISPWVGKGVVENKGKNKGGEYTHTSIIGFLDELWGLDPLTPRVSWSSTFEGLITNKLRTDTPVTLPDPLA